MTPAPVAHRRFRLDPLPEPLLREEMGPCVMCLWLRLTDQPQVLYDRLCAEHRRAYNALERPWPARLRVWCGEQLSALCAWWNRYGGTVEVVFVEVLLFGAAGLALGVQ